MYISRWLKKTYSEIEHLVIHIHHSHTRREVWDNHYLRRSLAISQRLLLWCFVAILRPYELINDFCHWGKTTNACKVWTLSRSLDVPEEELKSKLHKESELKNPHTSFHTYFLWAVPSHPTGNLEAFLSVARKVSFDHGIYGTCSPKGS